VDEFDSAIRDLASVTPWMPTSVIAQGVGRSGGVTGFTARVRELHRIPLSFRRIRRHRECRKPESPAGGGKRFEVNGRTVRFDRRRIKSYEQRAQDRVCDDGTPAVIEQGEVVNPENGIVYRWMAGPLTLKASRHDVWNGGGFIVA